MVVYFIDASTNLLAQKQEAGKALKAGLEAWLFKYCGIREIIKAL